MTLIRRPAAALVSSIRGEGEVLLFGALTLVNATNFLFHVIVSRILTPAAYGATGAVLGLMLTLAVPVTAVQVVVTRDVARRRASGEPLSELGLRPLFLRCLVAGAVGGGMVLSLAPVLSSFLHLESLGPPAAFAAFVFLVLIGIVPRAVLLGHLRYRLVAAAALGGAVARIAIAPPLTGWLGETGAVASSVAGEAVSDIILVAGLQGVLFSRRAQRMKIDWLQAAAAAVGFTGFWAAVAVDTFLARHYLDRRGSGFYAAAATAGRTSLFLSAAVAIVAVPRFASERREKRHHLLVRAMAIVGVLSLVAAAFIALVSRQFVELLFGDRYLPSGHIVGLLALSSAVLGLLNVLTNYHVAIGSKASGVTWVAAAVTSGLIFLRHDSLQQIAVDVLVGGSAAVLLSAAAAFLRPDVEGTQAPDLIWHVGEHTLDLTVVVPFYNARDKVTDTLLKIERELVATGASFEIIAVSDGSTDGGELALVEAKHERVQTVVRPRNEGKGQALRVGLARAAGKYVGFIDADGDIDPASLGAFVGLMRMYEPDIILGSKRHPLSTLQYPPVRRLYSWGYQQLIRVLFRLNVRDTQTGLKVVRREVLDAVLPRMLEKRFAFDLELFVVARRLGFRRVFEAPIKIDYQFSTTVDLRAVWGMALDTLAIFYRTYMLRFYDRPLGTLNDHRKRAHPL